MITHVKFVSVPTGDQDWALEFWTQKVGFTLATDQPFSDSQRWIELAVADDDAGFVLFTAGGPGEPHRQLLQRRPGLRQCRGDAPPAHQRGVAFKSPPQKQPWVPSPSSATSTETVRAQLALNH